MTVRTAAQALDLVRQSGLVGMTTTGSLPSLVQAVVGGPVKGSWWGHPKGKLVFNLGEALHDSPEVLVTKLAGGKVTFVHVALWPALYRVVTDDAWRLRAKDRVGPDARRLLARVERAGEARLDELGEHLEAPARRLLGKTKDELEKAVLVQSESLHTERGSHTTRLRSWRSWASAETRQAAAALDFDRALAVLEAASCGAPLGLR